MFIIQLAKNDVRPPAGFQMSSGNKFAGANAKPTTKILTKLAVVLWRTDRFLIMLCAK